MTERDEFIDINQFASFETAGEMIEGTYAGASSVEMSDGRILGQHTLLTEEGFVTFNETSQLQILRRVPPGATVQIVYEGEEKHGANKLRRFRVRVARADLELVRSSLAQVREAGPAPLPEPAPADPWQE